jgi:circadian clock protein KaiC
MLLTYLDVTRLRATEAELRQAVRVRDEFFSFAIHELKDPLSTLLLSVEVLLDSLAEQLLEKINEDEQSRRRLLIDGIEGFRAASVYPDRMPRFLSAFCNQLRTYDVTAVVSEELALFRPEIDMPNPELADVVETVIMLRYVELRSQLYQIISIMKMR